MVVAHVLLSLLYNASFIFGDFSNFFQEAKISVTFSTTLASTCSLHARPLKIQYAVTGPVQVDSAFYPLWDGKMRTGDHRIGMIPVISSYFFVLILVII